MAFQHKGGSSAVMCR